MELNQLKRSWRTTRNTNRVIPSAFPEINLWEDLGVPEQDWSILNQIESITNSRLRDEQGLTAIVPVDRKVHGPGASFIMAPFTHLNPDGSRFSDGSYGVYYAADKVETAIREVAYHRAAFMADTNESPQSISFRLITADLKGVFYDLFDRNWEWLRSDDYSRCREFGARVRDDIDFVRYESVRHPENIAFAVFNPQPLSHARHRRYIDMYWNGQQVTHSSSVDLQF